MKNTGIALRDYFKSQKMTQQKVADILGVSQPFIGRVFRGDYSFGKNVARQWSDAFGFSYSFLLTGEGSLFDNDASLTVEQASEDVASGVEPDSAMYWKNKYDEVVLELERERAISEGLRIALGAVRGYDEPKKNAV